MEQPGNSEFTSDFFNKSCKALKIRRGHSYAYKCSYIHSNKNQCQQPVIKSELCKRHYILQKSKKSDLNEL